MRNWADAFHAYGAPHNPAKSCPKWFQIVSTGVATFTDTIVRLHYDATHGYGVGFYGDRADPLFAQWLVGYLKNSVWAGLNHACKDQSEWSRIEAEDFRKAMAVRLSARIKDLRRERNAELAPLPIVRELEPLWFWSMTNLPGAMRSLARRNTRVRALRCVTRLRHTRVVWHGIRSPSLNN